MRYQTFNYKFEIRLAGEGLAQRTDGFWQYLFREVAARGFTVVAPDLFSGRFIDKMPVRHDPALEDDAALAIDFALALPEARGRPVLTLRELAGEAGDIGDPAGQGEDVFRACRDEIRRCLEASMDRLLVLLSG